MQLHMFPVLYMLLTWLSAALKHVEYFNPEATYVVGHEIRQSSSRVAGHAEPTLGKGSYMACNHARSSRTMGWKTRVFCQRCSVASFRGLHTVTGSRSKHSENISKIAEVDCIQFVLKLSVRRNAECRDAIYCFANCSIVFSGRAWLIT